MCGLSRSAFFIHLICICSLLSIQGRKRQKHKNNPKYYVPKFKKPGIIKGGDLSNTKMYEYGSNHPLQGLSVPFFLYSSPLGGTPNTPGNTYIDEDFNVFWNNCKKTVWSKGVEMTWLMHLQEHPWRTFDPSEAALFVVPALFSASFYEGKNLVQSSLCSKPIEELSETLRKALKRSPWFKRTNGSDHLMVVSMYAAQKWLGTDLSWRGMLKNMIIAGHIRTPNYYPQRPSRCMLSVGHQSEMDVPRTELR